MATDYSCINLRHLTLALSLVTSCDDWKNVCWRSTFGWLRREFMSIGGQCDQMLEKKVAQFFKKLPKKYPMQFFHKSEVFQNSPKSCKSFGHLLLDILLPRTFINHPIWSHCWWPQLKSTRMEVDVIIHFESNIFKKNLQPHQAKARMLLHRHYLML